MVNPEPVGGDRSFTPSPEVEPTGGTSPSAAIQSRPRRLGTQSAVVLFGLLLLAAGSGALAAYVWLRSPDGTAVDNSAFANRLSALEMQVRHLAIDRGTKPAAGETEEDQRKLSTLENELATVETRVANIESKDVAGASRQAIAMLALAELVRASESDQSFTNELDILSALVPGSPEIKGLSQYSNSGVPTIAMLSANFPHEADIILGASRASHARGLAARAWLAVMNLVSVRRIGDVEGTNTEARLARAEVALKAGDLSAAVSEIHALEPAARQAAKSWMKDAEARLAVNQDVRALANGMTSRLSAAQARSNQNFPHGTAE